MRTVILALLLLPVAAAAQYEQNSNQQRLWAAMTSIAPAYEMLTVCERNVTAELVYKDIIRMAAKIVQNRQDIEITMEMWRRARAEAAMQYYDSIKQLARNPNGETCNSLENEIIEILGAGV